MFLNEICEEIENNCTRLRELLKNRSSNILELNTLYVTTGNKLKSIAMDLQLHRWLDGIEDDSSRIFQMDDDKIAQAFDQLIHDKNIRLYRGQPQ